LGIADARFFAGQMLLLPSTNSVRALLNNFKKMIDIVKSEVRNQIE